MRTSIQASIAHILRRHFLVRPRHFRSTQRLEHDYNLGPLDRLELAGYLEQQFHIDFQDQEIAEFQTFGSLVALVRRHMLAPPAPGGAARFQPIHELLSA